MFDVGFSELMVIALVGLIVIGPERLPVVARTLGHLLGRFQRYVSDVKADIHREIQIEELKKLQSEVTDQARDMERQVNERMHEIESSLNQSLVPVAETPASQAAESSVSASALPGTLPAEMPTTTVAATDTARNSTTALPPQH